MFQFQEIHCNPVLARSLLVIFLVLHGQHCFGHVVRGASRMRFGRYPAFFLRERPQNIEGVRPTRAQKTPGWPLITFLMRH